MRKPYAKQGAMQLVNNSIYFAMDFLGWSIGLISFTGWLNFFFFLFFNVHIVIICIHQWLKSLNYFLKIFYLFIFRKRGWEGERERETWMYGCVLCAPYWGVGLQPRHVPWLGIKPATPWFAGRCLIHWATPTSAKMTKLLRHTLVQRLWTSALLPNSPGLNFHWTVVWSGAPWPTTHAPPYSSIHQQY